MSRVAEGRVRHRAVDLALRVLRRVVGQRLLAVLGEELSMSWSAVFGSVVRYIAAQAPFSVPHTCGGSVFGGPHLLDEDRPRTGAVLVRRAAAVGLGDVAAFSLSRLLAAVVLMTNARGSS